MRILKDKVNPITVRSKKLIVDALIELMKDKPFSEITTKEISKTAGVARQTVYRNFESKEAILEHYIDTFYEEFIELVYSKESISLYELLLTYFNFWKARQDFVRNLIDNNIFSMILESHLKYLYAMGRDERFENLIFYERGDKTSYINHFSAGGLWYILKNWIEDDMKKTPSEMAEIVLGFYHINRLNLRRIKRKK